MNSTAGELATKVAALDVNCWRAGANRILHDAARYAEMATHHFELAWWRRQGAEVGSANGRGQVYFVRSGNEVWALRHYLRGGCMARLTADSYVWLGLERTRPWREWHVLRTLRDQGLPVPEPVAARVSRHGLFYRGDLITRRIEGAITLADVLRKRSLPLEDWRRIGCLLRRFQEVGLRHDDINASNVLVDAGGAFHLIDFDKACIVAPGAWRGENLARFRRSLLKQRNRNPRFAFDDAAWDAVLESYGDPSLEYAASAV